MIWGRLPNLSVLPHFEDTDLNFASFPQYISRCLLIQASQGAEEKNGRVLRMVKQKTCVVVSLWNSESKEEELVKESAIRNICSGKVAVKGCTCGLRVCNQTLNPVRVVVY